jgi:hypothetical protein
VASRVVEMKPSWGAVRAPLTRWTVVGPLILGQDSMLVKQQTVQKNCRRNTRSGASSPRSRVESVGAQELIDGIRYLECQICEGRASDRLRKTAAEDGCHCRDIQEVFLGVDRNPRE